MIDYANDEEQLDALKGWWAEYGQTVIIAGVVGISLVVGGNYYRNTRTETLQAASTLFDQTYGEQNAGAPTAVGKAEIIELYPDTPYAALASLAEAKALVGQGELAGAVEKLNWAIEQADQDAVKAQAQLRLARVFTAQKEYVKAKAVAEDIAPGIYAASVEEIKGDIAAAEGDVDTARNAYQGALTQVDKALPPHKAVIQLKLDGLGSR